MNSRGGLASTSLALLLALAAGCGGSNTTAPVPARSQVSVARATAMLKIVIPSASKTSATVRKPAYVSPATQSIAISFTPAAGGNAQTYNEDLTPASNPSCTASLISPEVCTVTLSLAPGAYTATFATYDGLLDGNNNPTGNVLSQNQNVPVTIVAGQPNSINVTLNGVPFEVALVPAPTSSLVRTGQDAYTFPKCAASEAVSVIGLDADGNYILGPGAPTPSLDTNGSILVASGGTTSSPNAFVLTPSSLPTPASTVTVNAELPVGGGPNHDSGIVDQVSLTFSTDNCDMVATFAGSAGMFGSTDGPGSAARFGNPRGIATDAAGNVYVADSFESTIRKITPDGTVSTLAGTAGVSGSADGQGSGASFTSPSGVAVDAAGNVYVADAGNCTIRVITPSGLVSTLAGTAGTFGAADGTGASASFNTPFGVAVDSAANIYVADSGNSTIRKITSTGSVSTLAGSAGVIGHADGLGTSATFNDPFGIAVDATGNVYVADTQNNTIRKITTSGSVSTLAGSAGATGHADGQGASASFNHVFGLAVDPGGNIYVGDTVNQTIRKIAPDGTVSTYAGTTGSAGYADGQGTAASFFSPEGVALDARGQIFVADYGNRTIRVIR